MNQNKQDKGFTLVELLIVIVILGILAAVTVFAVRGITDTAQTNSCETEERTIETAIEAFNANRQTDATQISDLTPSYLKDDPFAGSRTWDGVTPAVGPAFTADPLGAGRWNITFGDPDGPYVEGAGACA